MSDNPFLNFTVYKMLFFTDMWQIKYFEQAKAIFERRRTFLNDVPPQRVDQDGVWVARAVDDGQLALGQFEVLGVACKELCTGDAYHTLTV